MLKRISLAAFILGLSQVGLAQKVTCSGKLALLNGAIKVELDTETRAMSANTSEGDHWEGQANFFQGGSTKRQMYFIPTGFGNGIQLEFYKSGNHQVCIAPDRCTICNE